MGLERGGGLVSEGGVFSVGVGVGFDVGEKFLIHGIFVSWSLFSVCHFSSELPLWEQNERGAYGWVIVSGMSSKFQSMAERSIVTRAFRPVNESCTRWKACGTLRPAIFMDENRCAAWILAGVMGRGASSL